MFLAGLGNFLLAGPIAAANPLATKAFVRRVGVAMMVVAFAWPAFVFVIAFIARLLSVG